MISAGRHKFMPLFYAFNYQIYQDMKYYDLQNMAKKLKVASFIFYQIFISQQMLALQKL